MINNSKYILKLIQHPRSLIYSSLTWCRFRRKSPTSISTRVCSNQFEYKKILCWCLGLCFISGTASALKTDASQPIHIDADHLTVDQKNMVTVFTGNVVISQGSMLAHANLAQASQDKDGYKTIHMTGSPVTFSQLNDDGDKTEGQGNVFDYNTKNNLAVLTGRARVKKGDNLVMGDKLTYNTKTQIYSANSNDANGVSTTKSGRVTVILQPQKGGGSGSDSTIKLQ